MTRSILAILMLLAAIQSWAATYYVSARDGDDKASGLGAETGGTERPWKTLLRASQQTYKNGDVLLLRCEETHEGRLDLRVEDGEGLLRVANYGNCANAIPRIDGSLPVELIDRAGKRVARMSGTPGRVVAGGKALPRSFSRHRVVADGAGVRLQPAIPSGAPVARAQAYARTRDWLIEPFQVEPGAGGLLGLGVPKLQYPLQAGTAVALTGKEWMLTREGWVHDQEAGELIVNAAGAIRASERLPLLRIRGNGSTMVEGLNLDFAGDSAVEILVKGSAVVRNMTILAPARHGIEVKSASSFHAMDNRISFAGEDAIFIGTADRANVLRNTIRDTSMLEPMQHAVGAINVVRAKVAMVSQNRVDRSAYVGIRFGEGAEISSNLVVASCLALSDCAGIYTWQSSAANDRRPSQVLGNVVAGVVGNDEVKLGYRVWAAGIYLDDFTSAVVVSNNVIASSRQGIYFHNAFQNEVRSNVIAGSSDAGLFLNVDAESRKLPRELKNRVHLNFVHIDGVGAGIRSVLRTPEIVFGDWGTNELRIRDDRQIGEWLVNRGNWDSPKYGPDENSSQLSQRAFSLTPLKLRRQGAVAEVNAHPIKSEAGISVLAGLIHLQILKPQQRPSGCEAVKEMVPGPLSFRDGAQVWLCN